MRTAKQQYLKLREQQQQQERNAARVVGYGPRATPVEVHGCTRCAISTVSHARLLSEAENYPCLSELMSYKIETLSN